MFTSLMSTRRFAPLFLCQFFAAFGDNFLKTALGFLIVYQLSEANSPALTQIAAATFIGPYFFLSGLGGEFADRFDKAWVAQRIKFVEMFAAALAVSGFAFHSLLVLFAALFLFGILGALFGPVKYGILPDLLAREELPAGNALIEGGTFLAILLGTIMAGFAATGDSNPIHFAWLMILTAFAAWLSAIFIPARIPGAPELKINWNIFASTGSQIKQLRADPRLWWGGLVTSWFWLVGVVVMSLLFPLVRSDLGGTEHLVNVFLAIFSIAVALGSGLAAWLSAGRIIILPTLIGAVLLGVFAVDLGWASHNFVHGAAPLGIVGFFATAGGIHIGVDLAILAIAGGLFVVPTFAAVQAWAGIDRRARVVAGVNVLNAAFMVAGSLTFAALQKLAGLSVPMSFVLLGAATLVVAIIIGRTMPSSWMNDFLSMVFRAFFRLEVKGLENIDKAGPRTIIALNHVSFLDPPLATAVLPKRPVFAVDVGISQRWWIQPVLKVMRTMALDPLKPFSVRDIINAVRDGDTLVIFPEGRITVTGSLMKVYDGAGLIADKSDAMVVPVRIEGPEATVFSRLKRSQVRRRWFPKITVTVLEPVKLNVDPELKGRKRRQAAGAALYTIMSDLIFRTTSTDRTVIEALIDAAKIHGPNWLAIEDPVSGQMTYKRLLQAAAVLGRKLMPLALEGRSLGVMLPTSNGGVVTLFAVMSAGRVPAMINFTAGAANILAACRAADLDTILTSRTFVEKGRLGHVVEELSKQVRIVYLEDIRPTITFLDKLRGALHWKKPLVARKPDDWAAILFTSGSEGTPKGVVLSHRNMLANVAQAAARIDFGREDKLFNVLPIFHSFGLTAGTVLPLVSGVLDLSLSVAAALPHGAGAGLRRLRHRAVRHRHVPQRLCALGQSLRLPLVALRARRCRAGEGIDAANLSGEIRAAHPRRLWRHRDRAGDGAQHADVQQVRHRRSPAARHDRKAREGRGRRGGRPALYQGAERDARLCARRQTGRARAAAGGLARYRRHRHHRRAGFYHHQGPRQAVRQGRRRDGVAGRGRDAGRRPVAGQHDGGGGAARSAQGRAARHGHRQARRDALGFHHLCANEARFRTDVSV